MNRTVKEVMSRPVVAARESTSFKEIVELMDAHRISALPVVDEQFHLVGIVSEADLLLKEEHLTKPRRSLFAGRARRKERATAAAVTAAELMTSPVVTVDPDQPLAVAARRMHEARVKRLPVVNPSGRVIGVVSRADLLKVFLRSDEEIRDEVVDTVLVRQLMIDPSSIRVIVRRGVVTLEGVLERRSLVQILVSMVESLDGVVGVRARLTYEFDDLSVRVSNGVPWGVLPPSLRP
jgi:CBS-domain-containing membrane protein